MGDVFEILLRILWLPFEAWRESRNASRIGESKFESETLSFWSKFALIGGAVVLIMGGLGLWWWLR